MDTQIEEISKKMKEMDEIMNKNIFGNPIKNVQKEMQNKLLEFKKIFIKNLQELSNKLGNLKNNDNNDNVNKEDDEEITDLKTALEHKKYQVEILKKEFTKYEERTEEEINDLKTENQKLKYRISILLKTIEELEKNK
jgi:hypothetical protein